MNGTNWGLSSDRYMPQAGSTHSSRFGTTNRAVLTTHALLTFSTIQSRFDTNWSRFDAYLLVYLKISVIWWVPDFSGRSRPSGPGHPDHDKRRGAGLSKNFRPFGPHFGLKIRGVGSPGPSPGSATGFPQLFTWDRCWIRGVHGPRKSVSPAS